MLKTNPTIKDQDTLIEQSILIQQSNVDTIHILKYMY